MRLGALPLPSGGMSHHISIMIRRFRFATALVALLTLSAFAAEGAAALVFCAPVTAESHGMETVPADAHAAHGDAMPSDDGSNAADENHCPLGMTGSGSCAVASLPSELPAVDAAPITSDLTAVRAVVSLATGLTPPLFHPPRA